MGIILKMIKIWLFALSSHLFLPIAKLIGEEHGYAYGVYHTMMRYINELYEEGHISKDFKEELEDLLNS